jgi:hypothetical protein
MRIKQILGLLIGLVCILGGVYLLGSGYETSTKTTEKIKHKITGNRSGDFKKDVIGGVILVVVGAAVLVYFRKKR